MLPDLSGTWHIKRRIMHENARFEGTLRFTPKDDYLVYEERGTLVMPHAQTDAYRSYIYRVEDNAWLISYDDGRPFLQLYFKNGVAHYVHNCSPDTYRATFKIKNENEFVIAFAVSGPRKRYLAVTRLKRI